MGIDLGPSVGRIIFPKNRYLFLLFKATQSGRKTFKTVFFLHHFSHIVFVYIIIVMLRSQNKITYFFMILAWLSRFKLSVIYWHSHTTRAKR